MRSVLLALLIGAALAAAPPVQTNQPAPLAIGSPAPDFKLPGIDGKTYSLASFRNSKALAVIFTAVHCPTAEVYEARIKQLVSDYRKRGVAFAVIQPNNAEAVRLDEMGYTDLGDSLADMKIRASHRSFNFPFLYDGEKQEVSKLYGPVATPHVFVFDGERKLRYQGRIDSNPREAFAKVPDARNAIDREMREVLPKRIAQALQQGFRNFGTRMKGYLTNDAQIVGVESRTSSPVKSPRDKETLEHPQIKNLFPCGEGAGYAGGIVSAAMDGERCAEAAFAKITNKS